MLSRWVGLAVVSAAICGQAPAAPAPEVSTAFSGERAMARLHALMDLPRSLGHHGRARSIAAMESMLVEAGAAATQRHAVLAADTDGTPYELVNLLADFRPTAPQRFVLATHFDTRPWADEDSDPAAHDLPVPGANDGTSGVAVLLELAPQLDRDLPPEVGFTIVLFDGEELGRGSDMSAYCAGSRQLAAEADAPAFDLLRQASFGIVLDMVGDADLRIIAEPNSTRDNPGLVDHVWLTAATHGFTQFVAGEREHGVVDDHKFLTAAGVPSILLIDREYAPWHTRHDTVDKVSARSLGVVGEVVRLALLTYPWNSS